MMLREAFKATTFRDIRQHHQRGSSFLANAKCFKTICFLDKLTNKSFSKDASRDQRLQRPCTISVRWSCPSLCLKKSISEIYLFLQASSTWGRGCGHDSGCGDGCEDVPPRDPRSQNGSGCANWFHCAPLSDPPGSPGLLMQHYYHFQGTCGKIRYENRFNF